MTATSGRIGVPAPAAAPAAPATPVLSVTSPRAYRSLLRYGVTPFLLAIDLTAFGLACLLVGVRVLDLVLLPAVLALNASAGLYRSRLSLSVLDDAGQLAARALIAGALVVAGDALVSGSSSQVAVLVTAAAGIPIGLALRALGYRVVGTVRARGLVGHPTLVLGAGRVGAQVASLLLEHPEYGLRPVGFLDRDPLLDEAERPVRLLGGDDVLAETIVEFGVRDVVVAFGSLPESGLVEVIRTCDRLDCEIFFVPRLFELHSTNRDVDHVWGFPLVRMRRAAYRTFSWRVKRLLDVLAAAISLAALSPLMAVLAVAVRLEGGRGVIFRQVRVGLDGRPFQMHAASPRRHRVADPLVRLRRPAARAGGAAAAFDVDGRAAAAVEHPARRHERGRPAAGAAPLRGHLHEQLPPLRRAAPRPRRPHRLGAGARPARGHLHRGARPLRQLLHRELVPGAGPAHRAAHDLERRTTARRLRSPAATLIAP